MTNTLFLTALLPPAHVAHAVSRYQHDYFHRQGGSSALFLQPHIPILFSLEPTVDLFSGPLPPARPCRTMDTVIHGSAVYLRVDTGDVYETLRRKGSDLEVAGPYPAVSGIILRTDAQPKVSEDKLDTPPMLSPMKWRDSSLVILKVAYYCDDRGNPFGVFSETIFMEKLRQSTSLKREA